MFKIQRNILLITADNNTKQLVILKLHVAGKDFIYEGVFRKFNTFVNLIVYIFTS